MKYSLSLIIIFLLSSCNNIEDKVSVGVYGNSLNFDGVDDQLIIPNYNKLKIYSGTLEAWIKISKKNNIEWHAILAKELAYEITMFNYKPTAYDWKLKKIFNFADTIPINEWHHIALSFQDKIEKGSRLYFDGKPIGPPFKISILDQGSELYIGSNHFTDQYFCGNIDEIRIWNNVRTAEEINKNFNTEINPTSKGLVLYYKFNEGIPLGNNEQNQYIKDETPNNFTGNLHNFKLKGSISNFVNDSPLIKKKFYNISTFIYKNTGLIILILCILIFSFLFFRIKTLLITAENKKLNLLVAKRTNELLNSVQQKELLIQEIHHRVKNNLQLISSLLQFEIDNERTIEQKKPLLETARRLYCMSLVHEQLYQDKTLLKIDASHYINSLVNSLREVAKNEKKSIQINVNVQSFNLSINSCISIGFVISEMVSNSIQHAFNSNIKKPEINIDFIKIHNNLFQLIVKDNGIGLKNFKSNYLTDYSLSNSLGLKLVNMFSKQLNGKHNLINDEGFGVCIEFNEDY